MDFADQYHVLLGRSAAFPDAQLSIDYLLSSKRPDALDLTLTQLAEAGMLAESFEDTSQVYRLLQQFMCKQAEY